MVETSELTFADAAEQAQALARRIAGLVTDGGALVLTGGRTISPTYEALAALPLPWERIDVVLTDERWVPTDHADSNERQLREGLLKGKAAAARLTSLKTADPTPEAALAGVEAAVAALPRPFACTLLGMGEDGHIASLFPGGPKEALDGRAARLVVAGTAPDGMRRISLSMAALLDTGLIALLIRGEAKRRLLRAALAGDGPELPVGALLRQARCPVEIYWAP